MLLKGIEAAKAINEKIKKDIADLGRPPRIDIIRVGAREDDLSYERGIQKKMDSLGITAVVHEYPEDIKNEDFVKEFQAVNEDAGVDGILTFMPLPKQINAKQIAGMIDSKKDLDGISPINQAKVYAGDESGFAPCTAEAVIAILDHYGIDVTGKRVTVVGRSQVIGRPVSMMLMKKNATVTICHTKTKDLTSECKKAEIIVAAAGVPKMIKKEAVEKGAVVIDVGIHVDENGNMCGDVDFDEVEKLCDSITPVPGGVGSVTTSILASHVTKAAAGN